MCAQYGLNEQERLVLLVALAPAIGDEVATAVSEVAGCYFHTPTQESAVTFLINCEGVTDRVKARDLFRPTGRLIKHGLIVLDYGHRVKNVEATLDARIYLSTKAFRAMVRQDDDVQ